MTDPNQQQIQDFLKLLAQYNSGIVNPKVSGGSSSSGGESSGGSKSSAQSGPEVARSAPTPQTSRQLGLAAALTNFGAIATQDPELGNLASVLNLGASFTRPNADIGTIAPSVLGAMGYGPAASLVSMARNGFTTSNVLGLLGATVNPAFGLIGLANSISGGGIGNSLSSFGNTVTNPDSMRALNEAGVDYTSQIGNALNNNQFGMDTDAMDSLANSFTGPDSDTDTGSDTSSASDSGSSSSSDSSSSSSSSNSGSDSDSRNSASD